MKFGGSSWAGLEYNRINRLRDDGIRESFSEVYEVEGIEGFSNSPIEIWIFSVYRVVL